MENKDTLIKIAEQYLKENNITSPHMQCERVSLGLSLHLKELGIQNRIAVADIDINRFNGDIERFGLEGIEELEHHFIRVGSKILDATAGQFTGMPNIYFGSLPMWYKLV